MCEPKIASSNVETIPFVNCVYMDCVFVMQLTMEPYERFRFLYRTNPFNLNFPTEFKLVVVVLQLTIIIVAAAF